jgi:predicted nucleic acid-binding protein
MVITRVLDTNIIVKWFLLEEGSQVAEGFLEELLAGQARVLVPSSLFYEVAKVLWVRRRDGLTESTSLAIWQRLTQLPVTVIEWHELFPEALTLSYQHDIAVYDAVFVRLAQLYGCDLITADQKLLPKLAGTYGWVKSL